MRDAQEIRKLKALHLRNAFQTHIETLSILLGRVPEMNILQPQTRRVSLACFEGQKLKFKF